MPFGTIRNPLTLGASGQSDGSAYRALAESLASQQMQAGPSSGLNVLQAILGPLAQVANMNRAAEADSAYEQNRMKQYEEFQARQAEQERAAKMAEGASQRAELEKLADQYKLQGPARLQFLQTGEVPSQLLEAPKQATGYDAWLAAQPPEVQAKAYQVKAGLAPRAQAPSQAAPNTEPTFEDYQSWAPEQRAAYDAFKGRGSSTVGQSVNQQKQDQAVAQKLAQFDTLDNQLNRIDAAATKIGSNPIFNGGPLDRKVLDNLPEGQELQQAVAQALPVITALTRIPGLGSQSDFEGRLQALQFPSTEFPPEVNKRAIEGVRQYVADLRAALESTSVDGGPAQAANAAPSAPTAGPRRRLKFNPQTGELE